VRCQLGEGVEIVSRLTEKNALRSALEMAIPSFAFAMVDLRDYFLWITGRIEAKANEAGSEGQRFFGFTPPAPAA
jgi:hypothetical protein